mmetsp:Transcript_11571/g.25478  ORF Transcript_11571/g.25478 Transcript_11571/m.25478 type:complete len:120 (+) Transcript_11571:91-450(+)
MVQPFGNRRGIDHHNSVSLADYAARYIPRLSLAVAGVYFIVYSSPSIYRPLSLSPLGSPVSSAASSITLDVSSSRKGPFEMPIRGEKHHIFQPLFDMDKNDMDSVLLSSPAEFVATFEK